MLKQATLLKITGHVNTDALTPLVPVGPTSTKSTGWVPPRGIEHGDLIEANSGASVLCFAVETRQVPASAVAEKLAEQVKLIEAQTRRKPGKKERRDLKEEIIHTLLPHAFPKRTTCMLIADGNLLIAGTTSKSMIDDLSTALVKSEGVVMEYLQTQQSPATAMSTWLAAQEAPAGFEIGRACELKAADESCARVRYTNHPLLTDEVLDHIAQGKVPTSLAVEFDGRIDFVLTDGLQLKKIGYGDAVTENAKENGIDPGDFDGSMAIAIGELRALMPDLIEALGGEVVVGGVSV